MSKDAKIGFSGRCLCGSVSFKSENAPILAGHCHCVDCRKSSGTGHGTNIVIMEDGFTVKGEVKFYDHSADSGNVVSRGFCPNCGSPIYSKNNAMPGMVFPRASALDDLEVINPQLVVYASRAASWDIVDPNLKTYDEMPTEGLDKTIADNAE